MKYEVTPDVVKDLICNHDFCADEPCVKVPVGVTGTIIPPAKIGRPWRGVVVFGGTLPLTLAVSPLPAWMTAETGPNFISLWGTPTEPAGTVVLSVSGADSEGHLVTETVTIEVSEQAEEPEEPEEPEPATV